MINNKLGVWFPAVRTHTGTDVFSMLMVDELRKRDIHAEIHWLNHNSEWLPWAFNRPAVPEWADIVHINSWLPPKFIDGVRPVVATVHHSIYEKNLAPFKGFLRTIYHKYWINRIEYENLMRADRVVAVSKNSASILKQQFNVERLQVIHNGVPLEQELVDRTAWCTPIRLIYSGSWSKRKGVDFFSGIMKTLGAGFELVVVGGEPGKYERKKMPDNIIFLGRIERPCLMKYLQQSDCFLFPSRSEGLSLALIEAQQCGLPVICLNWSSMPEIVNHMENGLLVDNNEISSWVNAIRVMFENEMKWRVMRENSYRNFKNKFNIHFQVDKYIELYNSILEKN